MEGWIQAGTIDQLREQGPKLIKGASLYSFTRMKCMRWTTVVLTSAFRFTWGVYATGS